jgi:hypothetical protein
LFWPGAIENRQEKVSIINGLDQVGLDRFRPRKPAS